MNENKFILDNFFNNNEKNLALNLEPLEPQEIIFLVTDWISEFCDIKIISIFKIKNYNLDIYQYFTLDSEMKIMEYIPNQHTFTPSVHKENKNMQQSKPQSTEKPAAPFGNLKPAEIPTKSHTYTYNGKSKKRFEK